MRCSVCIPTWNIYKSYNDVVRNEIGVHYEQRLPIDKAYHIYSIYSKKNHEAYLRYQVNKMNVSDEERERIYLELLNG